MSVTILEALQNAEVNLVNMRHLAIAFELGKGQLRNAIAFLELGHPPTDEIDLEGKLICSCEEIK